MPAFANASENSEMTALVSDDPKKLKELGDYYEIGSEARYSYAEYDKCLDSGQIDAVYIGLPNTYAPRVHRAGRPRRRPRALREADGRDGGGLRGDDPRLPRERGVKLMIAYRLHFEEANLDGGRAGRARAASASRGCSARSSRSRSSRGTSALKQDLGGGPLYDIGIYCINAARYLFRAEPTEVFAFKSSNGEARFREVEEMVAATLRFPGDRLAQLHLQLRRCASVSSYRVAGTKGDIRLDPAYEYFQGPRTMFTTLGGKTDEDNFPERDQFAPQLVYFSDCILNDREPEPSGEEGWPTSASSAPSTARPTRAGCPVKLAPFNRSMRPTSAQVLRGPAPRKPALVHAADPSGR